MNARQRRIFLSWLARISKPFTPTYAASAAEVYSSNIVGYKKLTLQPGLNMIGAAFGQIGDNDAQAVQKIFSDNTKLSGGPGPGDADNILTWDPVRVAYTTYYLYYDADYPEYCYNWYFGNDDEITAPLPAGTGFWYQNRAADAVEVSLSGEINTNESTTITVHPGLNMITYPYACNFDINAAVDWANSEAFGGPGPGDADNILTWDPVRVAYTTYYLYYDADYPEYCYNWYFGNDDEITAPLPAGMGFWYQSRGNTAFDLVFPKPY